MCTNMKHSNANGSHYKKLMYMHKHIVEYWSGIETKKCVNIYFPCLEWESLKNMVTAT